MTKRKPSVAIADGSIIACDIETRDYGGYCVVDLKKKKDKYEHANEKMQKKLGILSQRKSAFFFVIVKKKKDCFKKKGKQCKPEAIAQL